MNLVGKEEVSKALPPNADKQSIAPDISRQVRASIQNAGFYRRARKALKLDSYFYLTSIVFLIASLVFTLWFSTSHGKAIDKQFAKNAATRNSLQMLMEELHSSHLAYVESAQKKISNLTKAPVTDETLSKIEDNAAIVQQTPGPTKNVLSKPHRNEHVSELIPAHKDQLQILQQRIENQSQQLEVLSKDNYELRLALNFGTQDKVIDSRAKQPTPTTIVPSKELDTSTLVHRAFDAFNNQQIDTANSLYQQALQHAPQSRDANLGVAAIAIQQGNMVLAVDRYRYLLALDPLDLSAFNALLKLSEDDSSLEVEMIGHISQYEPQSHILYRALGSYYSRQNKWNLAAHAFEKSAAVLDAADDYYNLALSLDHTGKRQRALAYYQKALDYASGHNNVEPLFSVQEVQARMAEISETTTPNRIIQK